MEGISAQQWAQLITAFATMILALWALISKVIPWLRKKLNIMFGVTAHEAAHANITETLKGLDDKMEAIFQEFKPNGGSSLRDAVDNLHCKVEHVNQIQYAFMSSRNEPIFKTDKEGNCVWVNDAYIRLTGRGFHELKGRGWINVLHPDTRERDSKAWYDSVKEERAFEEAINYITADGETIPVYVHSYALHGTGVSMDQISGYIGVVRRVDVSESREKDEQTNYGSM